MIILRTSQLNSRLKSSVPAHPPSNRPQPALYQPDIMSTSAPAAAARNTIKWGPYCRETGRPHTELTIKFCVQCGHKNPTLASAPKV